MMTRFIRRWNGKSSTSDNSPSFAVGADPSPAEDNSGGWWCKRQEGGVWAAFFLLLLFQPVYRLKQLLRSPRTTQILKHHHKTFITQFKNIHISGRHFYHSSVVILDQILCSLSTYMRFQLSTCCALCVGNCIKVCGISFITLTPSAHCKIQMAKDYLGIKVNALGTRNRVLWCEFGW